MGIMLVVPNPAQAKDPHTTSKHPQLRLSGPRLYSQGPPCLLVVVVSWPAWRQGSPERGGAPPKGRKENRWRGTLGVSPAGAGSRSGPPLFVWQPSQGLFGGRQGEVESIHAPARPVVSCHQPVLGMKRVWLGSPPTPGLLALVCASQKLGRGLVFAFLWNCCCDRDLWWRKRFR